MAKKTVFTFFLLVLLFAVSGIAYAANGVLACVGRHIQDVTNASFQLSNFNDDKTITLDTILVYDMSGDLLCEGPSGWTDPPPTLIPPNGGTWFSVARMINWGWCPDVPVDVGWVIIKIHWSSMNPLNEVSAGPAIPLFGRTTEAVPGTSRAVLECENVQYSVR
jgi:hypothetical protein